MQREFSVPQIPRVLIYPITGWARHRIIFGKGESRDCMNMIIWECAGQSHNYRQDNYALLSLSYRNTYQCPIAHHLTTLIGMPCRSLHDIVYTCLDFIKSFAYFQGSLDGMFGLHKSGPTLGATIVNGVWLMYDDNGQIMSFKNKLYQTL